MSLRVWLGFVTAIALLLAAAPAGAAPFVYATNEGSDNVSQYEAGPGGLLKPLFPPTVPAGTAPQEGVAASPDGGSLYVVDFTANFAGGEISQYDVSQRGKLSPKSPRAVATGDSPHFVAVSPDGRSVYVTNFVASGPQVFQYNVGPGGTLTPKSPPAVPAGGFPERVTVSPDGRSVYVANFNFGHSSISQYDVGPGGRLSPKSPPTVPSGNGPVGVTVSPDGRSVYAANFQGASVSQYDVGPGGKLSPKSPASVETPANPRDVAVSPDGKSAYVTDTGFDSISQYDVGPGGRLTPKSPPTVPSGNNPVDLAISPDGQSVYAPNAISDDVSQFDVGAGGKLSPKHPAAVAAGHDPQGIALSPLTGPPGKAGWEGFVRNAASGCKARVQVPYVDQGQVTAYTEVVCPRRTELTIRSRLRSDYPFADITVDQRGCVKGCRFTVPRGNRFFRLACPKSRTRRQHQRYYSDIVLFPGNDAASATEERSRGKFLSPFCAY